MIYYYYTACIHLLELRSMQKAIAKHNVLRFCSLLPRRWNIAFSFGLTENFGTPTQGQIIFCVLSSHTPFGRKKKCINTRSMSGKPRKFRWGRVKKVEIYQHEKHKKQLHTLEFGTEWWRNLRLSYQINRFFALNLDWHLLYYELYILHLSGFCNRYTCLNLATFNWCICLFMTKPGPDYAAT